jgi:hypothetical protein
MNDIRTPGVDLPVYDYPHATSASKPSPNLTSKSLGRNPLSTPRRRPSATWLPTLSRSTLFRCHASRYSPLLLSLPKLCSPGTRHSCMIQSPPAVTQYTTPSGHHKRALPSSPDCTSSEASHATPATASPAPPLWSIAEIEPVHLHCSNGEVMEHINRHGQRWQK